MKVRLALVQPASGSGRDESRNAHDAVRWLKEAAKEGADLVMFPEGYPGPINPANHYDAFSLLRKHAAELGVHVVASRAQAVTGGHAVEVSVIDDRGIIAGSYLRTSPRGPYVYRDIDAWNFDYIESNVPPLVIETRLGKIGLLVCSELYVPELSRLLALQGADMILYPAGGAINELLPGWRTLVWARAIENLVFTAACQNLYGNEEGVATISSPERVLAARVDEGLLFADLDLQRLAYLRSTRESITFPKPYATIPGLIEWRRPELYTAREKNSSD
jgi:predicted amidohydrolase